MKALKGQNITSLLSNASAGAPVAAASAGPAASAAPAKDEKKAPAKEEKKKEEEEDFGGMGDLFGDGM